MKKGYKQKVIKKAEKISEIIETKIEPIPSKKKTVRKIGAKDNTKSYSIVMEIMAALKLRTEKKLSLPENKESEPLLPVKKSKLPKKSVGKISNTGASDDDILLDYRQKEKSTINTRTSGKKLIKDKIPVIALPKQENPVIGKFKNVDKNNRKKLKPISDIIYSESFRFRTYFKRTDDEKSIRYKVSKISASINALIGNKKFLKSLGLAQDVSSNVDMSTAPISLECQYNFEGKEVDFIVNVKSDDEKIVGRVVEDIQDKFFVAERKQWCKCFVYLL